MRTMAVLFLITGLLIVACKKDNPMQVQQNTNTELDDHSTKVLTLIKTFDKKMKSTLKGDERIHIDSVVWNSEALQNYNYAFPDTSTKNFIVYREDYTLSLNASNMALLSDVQSLNTQMEDDILDKLDEIDSDEAFLRFCDVVLDSIVSNTAYVTAINGFGYNLVLGYYPFSEDDDWIWGTLNEGPPPYGNQPEGKCDGTMQGVSDGSNEITWRLLYGSNTWVGGSGGYTDLVTIEVEPGDFENQIYIDYTGTPDKCLYNENLEYYLLEADEIIYNSSPTGVKPAGKNFVSIEIDDTFTSLGGNTVYCHYYKITYGIPYQNSGL